ncbi:hypothetical protein [Kineosporia succinea]|uniref:Uncharacterized protein n=1 Tax=Kineosporia succinea TaxID=84632 RepID=A0ABT9NXQ8_9ACTN|nr:hypothetical protein [Kineosporia succinea]MDP9825202.1 hypothetical protein [Kineosporia succinea]
MTAKTGSATTTVITSKRVKNRKAKQRRAEEREWSRRNGPVTVTRITAKPPRPESAG